MSGRKIILPVVGASLIGAGAYLAYLYVKRDREDEDEYLPKSGTYKTLEIEVPQEAIGALVGRAGCVIKELQEKSNCRIQFRDANQDSDIRILLIRGDPENIQMAKLLVTEILENEALIGIEEIWVPQTVCGRLIGRNGDNIKKLQLTSNAKVDINNTQNKIPGEKCMVRIRGTPEQRVVAKSLIEEIVTEDEEIRKNLALRQPRGPQKAASPGPSVGKQEVPALVKPIREKFIEKGQVDGQIEVYVSAVEDPSKFWVQIVGPKATELDQLVDQMTEYYAKEENITLHQLQHVQIGDLVAAQFEFDKKWYRAEVTKISPNPSNPTNELLNLYFVDYGDTGTVPKSNAFELRTDYLKLRFQAIECFLASVEPNDEKWDEEAIVKFDELTHVAQWKKLWSKVVQYKERRREGSPVPGIHLFDASGDAEINIGDEMVKYGHGRFENMPKRVTPKTSVVTPKTVPPTVIETPATPQTPPVIEYSSNSDKDESTSDSKPIDNPPLRPVIDYSSESDDDNSTVSSLIRDASPKLILTNADSTSESSADVSFSTPMNKTANNNVTVAETNGNSVDKRQDTNSFLDNERGAGDATPTNAKKQLFDQNKF